MIRRVNDDFVTDESVSSSVRSQHGSNYLPLAILVERRRSVLRYGGIDSIVEVRFLSGAESDANHRSPNRQQKHSAKES